jgi:hypothetical protein
MIVGKTGRQMHFSARKFGKFMGGGKFVGGNVNTVKTSKTW